MSSERSKLYSSAICILSYLTSMFMLHLLSNRFYHDFALVIDLTPDLHLSFSLGEERGCGLEGMWSGNNILKVKVLYMQ